MVDYVLTITVSIAAAGDAIFSLLGENWASWKLPCEYGVIVALIFLNLRGVKESVEIMMPVFVLFLVTHAILIIGSIALHITSAGDVLGRVAAGVREAHRIPILASWESWNSSLCLFDGIGHL